jgi:hypothetical protein
MKGLILGMRATGIFSCVLKVLELRDLYLCIREIVALNNEGFLLVGSNLQNKAAVKNST